MSQLTSFPDVVWNFLLQPITILAAIVCVGVIVVVLDFVAASRSKTFNVANENKIVKEANAAVDDAFGGDRGRLLRQFDNLTRFRSNVDYYKKVEKTEADLKRLREDLDALVVSRAETAIKRDGDSARLTRDGTATANKLEKFSAEFVALRALISRWVNDLARYYAKNDDGDDGSRTTAFPEVPDQDDLKIPAWYLKKIAADFAEFETADPGSEAGEKKENPDDGGGDDGSGSAAYEPKMGPK